MSEGLVRICWLLLAAIHLLPAMVVFRPGLVETLYGASPEGVAGTLLLHRGATFLAIVVVALWAAWDPVVRRLASVVLAVSIVSFLALYLRASMPAQLRTIAIADIVALAPLAVVGWAAWRGT